jgi:hypothetical protein
VLHGGRSGESKPAPTALVPRVDASVVPGGGIFGARVAFE